MPNKRKDPLEVKQNAGVAWKLSTIQKLEEVSKQLNKSKSELSEEAVLEMCNRLLKESNL